MSKKIATDEKQAEVEETKASDGAGGLGGQC